MRQLWAPWRMTYVTADAAPAGGCLLCEALAGGGEAAPFVVDRAPHTITVLNRYPYSSGHLMVVPHRHVADVRELGADEGAALFTELQRALRALDETMHPGGYNIGLNAGRVAGGSVDHLHLHVVPRWDGDTNFMPVLADVKVLPEHLEATAARLREAFSTLAS